MEQLVALFKTSKAVKLANLLQFKEYPVLAAIHHGSRYKLLLDNGNENLYGWTNWNLGQQFDQFTEQNKELYDQASGYIFSLYSNLASLVVRGKGLNEYGHWNVYTKL